MTIGCNIWMICLKLNWFFCGLTRMLQFSQFVWTPSVWDVFNNFLLIDVTDTSKISSDQKRFFIALSLYPLSFFANTPFKKIRNLPFTLIFLNFDGPKSSMGPRPTRLHNIERLNCCDVYWRISLFVCMLVC